MVLIKIACNVYQVTSFRLEASLLDNILGHVVKLVSNTKMMDDATFSVRICL